MRFKIILVLLLSLILNNLAYAREEAQDLGEIAAKFQTCAENISQEAKNPEVLIFVSLSMPEQSLKLWAQQAEKVDGILLLRGLIDNSIQVTTQKTVKLFSDSLKGGFNIDPEKFTQYHIQSVPAVVLTKGQDYDVVYGDTSLESALEYIAHHGSDLIKKQAANYLKVVRAR